MNILNDLKKEAYIIERLIHINNTGSQQEQYMNMAYDIVLQNLKHLIQKYE